MLEVKYSDGFEIFLEDFHWKCTSMHAISANITQIHFVQEKGCKAETKLKKVISRKHALN